MTPPCVREHVYASVRVCTRVHRGLLKTCLQHLHREQNPSAGYDKQEEIRETKSDPVSCVLQVISHVFCRGAERPSEGAPVWLWLNNMLWMLALRHWHLPAAHKRSLSELADTSLQPRVFTSDCLSDMLSMLFYTLSGNGSNWNC